MGVKILASLSRDFILDGFENCGKGGGGARGEIMPCGAMSYFSPSILLGR